MTNQNVLPLRISYQLWGMEVCRLFIIPLGGEPWALTGYWPHGLTQDAAEFITQHCQCAYCRSPVTDLLNGCDCEGEKDDTYVLEVVYHRELFGKMFDKILDRESARCKRRKRKSLVEKNGGRVSKRQLIEMLTVQKCMCYFCAAPLADSDGEVKFHGDHYDPLFTGGANSVENMVLTCATCNLRKGSTHGDDFERKAKKLRTAAAGVKLGRMRRDFNRWRASLHGA